MTDGKKAILTGEMVSEAIRTMQEYEREHYGLPAGFEYPLVADALVQSGEAAMLLVFHHLMVGMCGRELSEKLKDVGPGLLEKEREKELCNVFKKLASFRNCVELVYLGYVLGKRMAEVETLEKLG